MAVTTTVQDILDAAYTKSTKNTPGTIATEATELLEVVTRALRGLYAFAARVNPIFFATTADVAFASGGWARPEEAESIFRIEALPGLTEVSVVPFDDKAADPKVAAVYQLGQRFYPAGNALDPVSGSLRFYFAKRAAKPANLGATLDATWVESYNELLALEVAIHLATKDGRTEEVPHLIAERDRSLPQFLAFLEHQTVNERRRIGHARRFNVQSAMPLLAGGAA